MIPEKITMEFFGMNLLETNRSMWEKYIYSIYDVGEDDGIGTRIPIGNYEVMHNYTDFDNQRCFCATLTYNNDFDSSQILFDESGKLKKIDIKRDMGEEFSTSFLNIGDNVKDYFESLKNGFWDEFLKSETIVATQGWNLRHTTTSMLDFTYDSLQIFNKDLYISYLIKDEVVEFIFVYVIGDIDVSQNSQMKAEASIYDLENFEFYIKGKNIAEMSGGDWVDTLGGSVEGIWREFFEFSEKNSKYGQYRREAGTVVDGLNVSLNYVALEERNELMIGAESVSKLKNKKHSEAPFRINFSLSKDGMYNIDLQILGETSLITSNYIMPGDNIKTFLNSYEEGLFEKIMSLPEQTQEYTIGPYYFSNVGEDSRGGTMIALGKRAVGSGSGGGIIISFENEIVTYINCNYYGNVTGFEEQPVF